MSAVPEKIAFSGAPTAKNPAKGSGSRVAIWSSFAVLLLAAPHIFGGVLAHMVLSQIGIAIIICLSYNILLGQGGMLSFGHAVYSGMGSFLAIHTLSLVEKEAIALPVSLVPVVGGLAALGCAAVFGYVTTKKAGTPFAMITLGIGELVWASSLMFPQFFGGEGGVSANRVTGSQPFGVSFGPQIQLYYLIAGYTFVCTALMYLFTCTPLGRMLNAVRDNPERVEFIGYDTQRIRYLAFLVAAFFAGIGGGLAALNFEMVTSEVVSGPRSGAYLLFTFLGGAGFFIGPIFGAVLMVLAIVLLSELTKAWLLYLGLLFLLMVMFAPGGIASLISANLRVFNKGHFKALIPTYIALAVTASLALAGSTGLIEMIYHLQLNSAIDPRMALWGISLHTRGATSWVGMLVVALVGWVMFDLVRRRFVSRWSEVQELIQASGNSRGHS